jgi:uncharacterized protein (UPF0276 family)
MNKLTTYFDTAHSFLEGAARLFDFGGSLNTHKYADFPKRSNSPHESDINAIASDWMAVGGDLRRAIEHSREQEHVTLDDSVIEEARNQLMQDKTMQELVALRSK